MHASRDLHAADLTELLETCQHPAVRELLAEFAQDGTEDYDGRFLIVDGDCTVEGHLDTDDHEIVVLVVRGDLTVAGTFRDRSDDGPTVTIVLGSLRAKNVITAGLLEVHGDLHCEQAVVGDYNDGGALVHGDLTTDLFLPVEIRFEVRGALRAEEQVPPFTHVVPFHPRRLAPRFFAVTEGGVRLFEGEAGDAYVDALAGGQSILAG